MKWKYFLSMQCLRILYQQNQIPHFKQKALSILINKNFLKSWYPCFSRSHPQTVSPHSGAIHWMLVKQKDFVGKESSHIISFGVSHVCLIVISITHNWQSFLEFYLHLPRDKQLFHVWMASYQLLSCWYHQSQSII